MTKKFENRVRFNWGFHDAALAVQKSWDTASRNYGFGSFISVLAPSDVLANHPDHEYAEGWFAGYCEAKEALYAGNNRPETSDKAWMEAVAAGKVAA